MTDARVDLGLVTIGQTPRPDLDAAFRQEAPGARIETVGALDGLDHAALEDLAGRDGDYPLLVQLADGSTLEIDRDALVPAITAGARSLAARGAQLVVVVCAGSFPDVDCAAPVLFPGRLLPAIVKTLSRTRRIGVVTPVAGQVDAARTKWQADGFDVRVTSASPVRHDEIAAAAETMADPTLDLVLLDCMGHGQAYRHEFMVRSGRPVLLAPVACREGRRRDAVWTTEQSASGATSPNLTWERD